MKQFILLAGLLLVPLALVAAACGDGDDDSGGGLTKVTLMLDWTPNTNHAGVFLAKEKGYYKDAGLDVDIQQPGSGAGVNQVVGAGTADFGIAVQESVMPARAEGIPIVSIAAIIQHNTSSLISLANDNIKSPKDLAGKTYGGFGGPGEEPKMRAVIQDAGGVGSFSSVVLGTAAYEALYGGQVDFAEPFLAWEGIEAELRGQPLKTFAYTDFGFPDAYGVLLVGHTPWLAEHPDLAAAFVQAAQRGYRLGADDPARAAQLLMEANPGAFTEPELVTRSQDMLAERFLRDPSGAVGPQTAQMWDGFSGFLFDTGALAGSDGLPLTVRPEFSAWFTNDYLETP